MKSYVLNTLANKIEVYEAKYVPEKFIHNRPTFYSNSTLFLYRGSISLGWKVFNTAHARVEDCKKGNCSNQNYYGGRTMGQHFFPLKRHEAIELFKAHSRPEPL